MDRRSQKKRRVRQLSLIHILKVQDTTPPKVTTGKSLYTLEVDSDSTDVLNTEKTVKAIVDMVKADVRTDESVKDIQVYTLEKEQFRVDEKAAVVIKAEDLYGNIGSHQDVYKRQILPCVLWDQ